MIGTMHAFFIRAKSAIYQNLRPLYWSIEQSLSSGRWGEPTQGVHCVGVEQHSKALHTILIQLLCMGSSVSYT